MGKLRIWRVGAIVLAAAGLLAVARPALAVNSVYLCVQADSPRQLKDIDATIAACTDVIQNNRLRGKELGNAYYNRAIMYGVSGKPRQALDDENRALEISPNDEIILANRGNDELTLGDTAAALADYTASIKAAPNFSYAYYLRGAAYESEEKWDEALTDYRHALAVQAGLDQALAATCRVLAITKLDLEDAEHMCDRADRVTVNVFGTFYSRSLLRLRLDKPAGALADAQTAVRLDPSSANAIFVEALSEEQLHRADDAAKDAAKAEALDPTVQKRFVRWGFDTKLQ
jgi:tetratricopeptide (TPR) repeat protein